MNERLQRYSWILFACIAVLTLASTLVLEARNFSPVPYLDMWDGYIGFDIRLSQGDLAAWIYLHNEHRIIFSRLLFWLDMHVFGGTTLFLIVCNYFLAGAAAATFASISRHALPGPELRHARWTLYAVLTTFCFSWVQAENLSWGFQSQFFAAQLFPLLAVFLLWRSTQVNWCFPVACVVGFVSAGTMANGVLALPCLLLLALILRAGSVRVVILAALSTVTLLSYFHGYHSNPEHGSISETILTRPLDMLRYVFLYLGNPIARLGAGARLGEAAGLFFCLSSLWLTWSTAQHWRERPIALCLLAYIAYLGATAFGTAGGRLVFGLEQALSGRYATPALMGWGALLILFAQHWAKRFSQSAGLQIAALLLMLCFIKLQVHHLKKEVDEPRWKMLAALAIEMGVRDEATIPYVYNIFDRLAVYADDARQRNISIFANPAIQDVHEKLGQKMPIQSTSTCQGTVDVVSAVKGDEKFRQVIGWIYSPEHNQVPNRLWITSADGTIIGYALTGYPRPDVAQVIDARAKYAGFYGYVLKSTVPATIKLVADDPACALVVQSQ
ncbi:hypothetical protein N5J43_22210 [Pseudomonas nicosulfuronedens]|uniref:hypothetical protein n=3 Tax=Pseudomonas nicosulfuronedens TaxID=2571105 RepID=UPI00244BAC51|nr:hypothetical protein [Pseudomonas nicosulfuronedens]MDH1008780.1 hypothetical protein [Pseudomonas nicosulfuronedens]MDH1981679.1 hypothetical protein [Pseudomonas nicosulfuronedens]MDH2028559.1 hypothetical protein [Pseudomonas nicosulfuronedens]